MEKDVISLNFKGQVPTDTEYTRVLKTSRKIFSSIDISVPGVTVYNVFRGVLDPHRDEVRCIQFPDLYNLHFSIVHHNKTTTKLK